ncbi:MAG: hypothetical protein AAF403_04415, partial [Pseudomonadota bacterium]
AGVHSEAPGRTSRPCLTHCPVGAFKAGSFNAKACKNYLIPISKKNTKNDDDIKQTNIKQTNIDKMALKSQSQNGYTQQYLGQKCFEQSCLARLACPVGQKYRYHREVSLFHMQAFVK